MHISPFFRCLTVAFLLGISAPSVAVNPAPPQAGKASKYVAQARKLKEQEKLDKALYCLREAEKIYRARGDRDSLVYVNTALAEVFRSLTLSKEALQYIELAVGHVNTKTPKDILAFYYNRRAAIENMFGSKVKALELSQRVVRLERQINDKEIVVYSYNEIGALKEFEFAKDRPEVYVEDYKAALKKAEDYKLLVPQMDILINLGRTYDHLKQYDREISSYNRGLEIAQRLNSDYYQYQFEFNLVTPYNKKGNMQQAYNHLMQAFIKSNQLKDRVMASKISEADKKYNVEKKENELRIKNIEIQNNNRHYGYSLVILALTSVATITLVYFYRKSRKTNKRLKRLSAENEFLLGEANHRINNNLQLIIVLLSDELKNLSDDQAAQIRILPKIESIAYLHRHLYRSTDKRHIALSSYLEEINVNFSELFNSHQVKVSFEIEERWVDTDKAMYLGLILTELLINSLKYAFGEQTDRTIQLRCYTEDRTFHFSYFDNGQKSKGTEVKPKLVLKLCRQIQVTPNIDTSDGFRLDFNTDKI